MPDTEPYPWLPLSACLAWLKVSPASGESEAVEACRCAAAADVERDRADLWAGGGFDADGAYTLPVFTPGDDVRQGAIMETARLLARRGSPAGIASYGDFGPAAVMRFDADIDRLIGRGRYAIPRVG